MSAGGHGPWLLSVALAAGAASSTCGEEAKGGLITRFFKRSAPAKRVEEVKTPIVSAAALKQARQEQALADWVRRSEVCLRLRDIAHENSDDELWRKADQLEQRAYDAYVQQLRGGPASVDEATLDAQLSRNDVDTRSRLLRPTGSRDQAGLARRNGEQP